MFYGKYKAKLDALSRISLPPQFLEILRQRKTEELIAHPGDHCIMLFEKKLIDSNYIRDDSERPLSYQKWFCKIDSKGKIIIPEILREFAELKTSVMIIGISGHIEIWSSKEWKSFYNTWRGRFEEITEKILSLPEKAAEEIKRSEELSESDKEGFLRAISNAEAKELKQLIMAIFVKSEKQLNEIMRIVRAIEDEIISQKKSVFKRNDTKLLSKIQHEISGLHEDFKKDKRERWWHKIQIWFISDVVGFLQDFCQWLLELKKKNKILFLLLVLLFIAAISIYYTYTVKKKLFLK